MEAHKAGIPAEASESASAIRWYITRYLWLDREDISVDDIDHGHESHEPGSVVFVEPR